MTYVSFDSSKSIYETELEQIQARFAVHEVFINVDGAAGEFIVKKGYTPELGARTLRRVFQQYVEDPIAKILLKNPDFGRRITISVKDNNLEFVDNVVFPRHQTTANEINQLPTS